jgi:hypothetical protein
MEGYRPAFDSDIELADAETADVEPAETAFAETAPAGAAPAGAPQMRVPAQVARFDPACCPPSEPYSLDGITVIPADVFRRSKPPR